MPTPTTHRGLDPTAQRVLQRSLSSSQQAWLRGDFDGFDRGGARASGARRDGMDSTWTGVAVRRVAEQVGKTPWRLVDDDDNIVESGPLFDLIMVAPNAHQDPRVFVESIVIELLTSARGSAVVIKDFGLERALRPEAGEFRRLLPRELLIADSTRFRAVWTRGSIHPRVSHYEYLVPSEGGYSGGGVSVIPFAPQELIAIALPGGAGHLDPLDGLSMRVGAGEAQALDREMIRYTTEYFAHDASPGTVLMTDSALSPSQIRQMRRDWDERHRGRSWRSAVLHKGLKLAPAPVIKDLAMPELAKQVRERQLAIFDTPPIVAGIVDDANRSNSDAQIAMFIYGAVASVADRIDTALTRHLIAAHPWPTPVTARDSARLIVSHARRDALSGMRAAARTMCERNYRSMRAVDRMADGAAKRMLYNPLEGGPETALTLVHDVDSHPAVARVKLEALASAIQLVANGQPLNDVLDLLDIPVPRRPEGDVARIPFSVAPAATLDDFDPAEQPDAPEPPDDSDDDGEEGAGSRQQRAIARLQRMLDARRRSPKNAAVTTTSAPGQPGAARTIPADTEVRAPSAHAGSSPAPGSGGAGAASGEGMWHKAHGAAGAMTRAYACGDECGCGAADQSRGIAERHRATVAPIAREYERTVRAHLRGQRDALLARVRKEITPAQVSDTPTPERQTRAVIGEDALERIVFNLRVEQERIVAALRPTLELAARLGAAQGAFEAGLSVDAATKAAGLMLRDPQLRLAMSKVGARMRLIEARRLTEVKDTIRGAFRDPSKTFNDLLQDLKRYYDGEFTSARRAALTETAGVTNTARYESMREQGVTGKLWLTASGRPRASHAAAEQTYGTTPIPIDEPFIVNGHALRFPGDPDAPAGERINCYCVQVAAFLDDDERSARTHEIRFLTIQEVETRDAA